MVFRQNSSEFEMPVFVINEVRSAREGSFWRRWQQLEWQGPWVCGHYGEEGDYIKEDKGLVV